MADGQQRPWGGRLQVALVFAMGLKLHWRYILFQSSKAALRWG